MVGEMKTEQMRDLLKEALQEENWKTSWDRNEQKLKVYVAEQDRPFDISIPQVLKRMKEEQLTAQKMAEELVGHIRIVTRSMQQKKELRLAGHERDVFPVIRSTSFPTQSKEGEVLVTEDHTAESRIYFAVDLGQSYVLIDEPLLQEAGWSKQELKEKALFNVRGLEQEVKQDKVAQNVFYFVSPPDGYAASRILNQSLLDAYAQRAEGDFCVATPHQDVLIMADIRNESGYDVLGQMTMQFYASGDIPVSALPFRYEEGELEPIFILAKRKPDNFN
jgi:uncharacterized protein YtpQ (UPF0354 family)